MHVKMHSKWCDIDVTKLTCVDQKHQKKKNSEKKHLQRKETTGCCCSLCLWKVKSMLTAVFSDPNSCLLQMKLLNNSVGRQDNVALQKQQQEQANAMLCMFFCFRVWLHCSCMNAHFTILTFFRQSEVLQTGPHHLFQFQFCSAF